MRKKQAFGSFGVRRCLVSVLPTLLHEMLKTFGIGFGLRKKNTTQHQVKCPSLPARVRHQLDEAKLCAYIGNSGRKAWYGNQRVRNEAYLRWREVATVRSSSDIATGSAVPRLHLWGPGRDPAAAARACLCLSAGQHKGNGGICCRCRPPLFLA